MNGRVGKKIKFYIGYLRNENVFVLYNADSYMGLFIKIVETGFPHTQAGWRQIRDEDIEDYRDGVDVLCYTGNYGRCPVSCFEVLEEAEADDFEDLDYRNTYLDPHGKEWRNNGGVIEKGIHILVNGCNMMTLPIITSRKRCQKWKRLAGFV